MHNPARRRLGALTITLGLLGAFIGLIAAPTPVAGLAGTEGLVCNNQKGDPAKDCVDGNRHGTIADSFDAAGNLVFEIDADAGFRGWRQIYICLPTSGDPTKSADCQGNTASVLDPRPDPGGAYDVTAPVDNDEAAKDVSFACSTSIDAVVDADALPKSETFNWTIHVNTCDGGTDEAFGSSTKTTPPVAAATYECVQASPIGTTSATLRGSTDDVTATSATFTFTAPSGAPAAMTDPTPDNGAFSVDASGLLPNTAYTYRVEFLVDGAAAAVRTAEGCTFATTALPETYACVAPTGVTSSSARLRGTTSDDQVDGATFTLRPGGRTFVGTADGDDFVADVDGLTGDTAYTYIVSFTDAGTEAGVTDPVCEFTTAKASATGVAAGNETRGSSGTPSGSSDSPAPSQGSPSPGPVRVLAGEIVASGPSPAASAVTPASLPRTGGFTDVLMPLGVGLVAIGIIIVRFGTRPEPAFVHASAPGTRMPAGTAEHGSVRTNLLTGALLAAGFVLGGRRR